MSFAASGSKVKAAEHDVARRRADLLRLAQRHFHLPLFQRRMFRAEADHHPLAESRLPTACR
jgi:hypothetical protein